MSHLPQPVLDRENGFTLAKLVDASLLPVLLERGEQPFLELYSSLTADSLEIIDPSELVLVGGATLFAYGQCQYLEGYRFITSAFDKLWDESLKKTEMLRATHFRMEARLREWHGYIGHDYGFELDAGLRGYVLKNSLS